MTQTITAAPAPPQVQVPWVGTRLSIMMFLQWAVPGVYLPVLSRYLEKGLGFSESRISWVYGLTAAVGAATAPFIAGQVADRYLNAERAMAGLLLVGGVLQFVLAQQTGFAAFLICAVFMAMAIAPTASLSNSISFHSLDNKEKRFPLIRVWGTIGWVAASGLFANLWLTSDDQAVNVQRMADALKVSGAIAVVYAVYCLLALPRTPPKRSVQHPLAFAGAFRLFLHPGFVVLALVALPISMVHNGYFMRAWRYLQQDIQIPDYMVGWTMGIGQVSEIGFLALLGFFLKRLGYRWVLALGALGYIVRYTIFAIGAPAWLVVAAQALHGLCFGCFFAGAFLYVERIATADIRHSAQTVLALVFALGQVFAIFYNSYFQRFTKGLGADGKPIPSHTEFWAVSAVVAVVATLALVVFFRPRLPQGAEGGERGV